MRFFKAEDYYKDNSRDVKQMFHKLRYEVARPSLIGKVEKVIGLLQEGLGGKTKKKYIELRLKITFILKIMIKARKKAKGTKNLQSKSKLNLRLYFF